MQRSTVYFPKVDPFEEKQSLFEIATYDMHRNKGCMRASILAKKHMQQFFFLRFNRLNWIINHLIIGYFSIIFDKFSMADFIFIQIRSPYAKLIV